MMVKVKEVYLGGVALATRSEGGGRKRSEHDKVMIPLRIQTCLGFGLGLSKGRRIEGDDGEGDSEVGTRYLLDAVGAFGDGGLQRRERVQVKCEREGVLDSAKPGRAASTAARESNGLGWGTVTGGLVFCPGMGTLTDGRVRTTWTLAGHSVERVCLRYLLDLGRTVVRLGRPKIRRLEGGSCFTRLFRS